MDKTAATCKITGTTVNDERNVVRIINSWLIFYQRESKEHNSARSMMYYL